MSTFADDLFPRWRQFNALTKPRVIQLIVFCALIGMVLAVPGVPTAADVVLGWPLLGALAHTGGAAALVLCLTWIALSHKSSQAMGQLER